jgi:predicted amidohydrolase
MHGMKVAVAQLAVGRDRAANAEQTIEVLREAARQGAKLVLLPELCTSPYQLGGAALESWAEDIPGGSIIQSWIAQARDLGICLVAGVLEREGERFFNTAIALNSQGQLARYRKAHLFGWERARLTPGDQPYLIAEMANARIGVLVCYELRFAEPVRLLALQKIQLLCVPAAWSDAGKPQPLDQYGFCGAAHLALGHAYANRIFVLCANRVGVEGGVRYLGNSLIAAPAGHALAGPAAATETVLLIHDIDPAEAEKKTIAARNDVLADRRTDLYSLETRIKETAHGLSSSGESSARHRRQ